MVSDVAVLAVVAAVVGLVLYWSGRYGDRRRSTGTSLRRGPHAHVNSRGRPKRAYASRELAEAEARRLTTRGGSPVNAYRCNSCTKWHVGHGS